MLKKFLLAAFSLCLVTTSPLFAPPIDGAAAQTVAAAPDDGGWPRVYTSASGAQIALYQPQIASWTDQKHVVMFAAVSYLSAGQHTPSLGTIKLEADTQIAVAERLVNFSQFTITGANFPTLDRDRLTTVVDEVSASVPRQERVIGLDRVMAAMDTSEIKPHNAKGLNTDPPLVFYSTTPAILVILDGDPIWSPIKDNSLKFAVNTNWDLFQDTDNNEYYLRVETNWLKAQNVDGPWTPAVNLPESFSILPSDDNWKAVKATLAAHTPRSFSAPAVFVSLKPAELIVVKGAPAYQPVAGTKLMWVSNTDRDVFRAGKDGTIYFLVSGRWFSASSFTGPWTFATPNVPDDFKKIPLEHPRSRVLASVPGTTQALEAVLIAQVPQTARVSRTGVKAPMVSYDGDPQFEHIAGTSVARAVNTDKDILKAGNLYYMCFQGVWFASASPAGPWVVSDAIPHEIYQIPMSSPSYNVTGVTIADSDADAVVYETAPSYLGMEVGWGVAMWGTGWYYPAFIGWGGYYPVYYPGYPSYGYGAWYNPWTGAYTRGGAAYGPYGGAGYAARYNPTTGTYSRGVAAWGPAGARGAAQAWNPATGTFAQTRQGANVYGSWGSTGVQRGDQWAQTARVSNRATGNTTRVTQGSGGGESIAHRGADGRTTVGRSAGGDVYAGHDGNVYRNQNGSWQKYGSGGWNDVQRPAQRPTGTSGTIGDQAMQRADQMGLTGQLDRDLNARQDGMQRTFDLGQVRSGRGPSGGFSGAGSFRPSGGMRFGGGGFRGGGGRRR